MKRVTVILLVALALTSCESEYKKQARRDLKEAQEHMKYLKFQRDSLDKAQELRHRLYDLETKQIELDARREALKK